MAPAFQNDSTSTFMSCSGSTNVANKPTAAERVAGIARCLDVLTDEMECAIDRITILNGAAKAELRRIHQRLVDEFFALDGMGDVIRAERRELSDRLRGYREEAETRLDELRFVLAHRLDAADERQG